MKKTIISILVCGCLLVGCNIQGQTGEVNQIKFANAKETQFNNGHKQIQDTYFDVIPNLSYPLVYDRDTKIIYYFCSGHYYYDISSPYYSENGKLCRYNEQEQKIEELKQYE